MIQRRSKPCSSVPVAAMGDIAFLLLIFFMLSSITEKEVDLKVELPKSRVSVQESNKFFNVWVDNEGAIYYDGNIGNAAGLTNHAVFKMRANPEIRALIRASDNTSFEHMNAVFDALKDAGLHYIVLVSEKK